MHSTIIVSRLSSFRLTSRPAQDQSAVDRSFGALTTIPQIELGGRRAETFLCRRVADAEDMICGCAFLTCLVAVCHTRGLGGVIDLLE